MSKLREANDPRLWHSKATPWARRDSSAIESLMIKLAGLPHREVTSGDGRDAALVLCGVAAGKGIGAGAVRELLEMVGVIDG